MWEILSGMVQSLALVSDGERVQGEVVLVGDALSRTSVVNTATTLQALPPYGWPLVERQARPLAARATQRHGATDGRA